MPEVLTGLSLLGWLLVIAVTTCFFFVQPVWSLIDCIESDRDRDTKILVGVLLFFTWGLGSVLYGVFFAGSKALRSFTVLGAVALAVLSVASFGTCVSAVVSSSEKADQRRQADLIEAKLRLEEFAPAFAAADAVAPFHALLWVRDGSITPSVSQAEFTAAGPRLASARNIDNGVRHVAHDPAAGRTFAVTQHEFGAISPTTGEFIEIGVDPTFEFSWPKGVVWDATAQRVVVLTSHVYTHLFAYNPLTSSWEQLAKLRGPNLVGLAFAPGEDLYFSIETQAPRSSLSALERFNRAGAKVGRLVLSPPIPLAADDDLEGAQLHSSSDKLVAILPGVEGDGELREADRVFVIDPKSGVVAAHRAEEQIVSGDASAVAEDGSLGSGS
jgi:hypothetical protein